tara:strand:- start:179 stop:526 length:348 start_codon:yes stop_codon:yes gene_type:complete
MTTAINANYLIKDSAYSQKEQIARNLMSALGSSFQTLVKVKQILIIDNGIQINFTKGAQGINTVIMTVNERDTIDMHFWSITVKTQKEIVAVGDLQTREEVQGVFENITNLLVHF